MDTTLHRFTAASVPGTQVSPSPAAHAIQPAHTRAQDQLVVKSVVLHLGSPEPTKSHRHNNRWQSMTTASLAVTSESDASVLSAGLWICAGPRISPFGHHRK